MLSHDEIRRVMPQSDSPAARNFGSRLRQARRAKGINARQIASALAVQPGSVYHWEQGVIMPSPENVRKLALFLGLAAELLLDLPWPSPTDQLTDAEAIARLLSDVAQMFGDTSGDYAQWSPAGQQYLASVLRFALEPIPDHLVPILEQYPTRVEPHALKQWSRRKHLVEWFFTATDAALDTVEDVVRRIGH